MLCNSISTRKPSLETSLSGITLIFQLVGIQYFSISPETMETSNGTSCLSKKFKIIFAANVALTIIEFAMLFVIHLDTLSNTHGTVATGENVRFISFCFMIAVIAITILNSFFLRDKARMIFKNLKIISKALVSVNQYVDYETFAREFKRAFAKLCLFFIGLNSTILIFLYHCCNIKAFSLTLLVLYPYFFILILLSYWIFLIRLIRESLCCVKNCLVQLHKNVKLIHHSIATKNHEIYNFIGKLKRIYGTICETTSLINELIAVPICLLLVLIVVGNVSSCYQVFLSFRKDLPKVRLVCKSILHLSNSASITLHCLV